jgi:glycerophosphoryl diester phosphodiesterase
MKNPSDSVSSTAQGFAGRVADEVIGVEVTAPGSDDRPAGTTRTQPLPRPRPLTRPRTPTLQQNADPVPDADPAAGRRPRTDTEVRRAPSGVRGGYRDGVPTERTPMAGAGMDRPIHDEPWAVAHRGEPRGHPENSIAGVLAAVDLGADAVELDVRTTRDGVAVLHHGRRLPRRSSRWWRPGTGPAIAELTREQLHEHAPRVPSLAELLAAVRGRAVRLVLDVGTVEEARAAAAALEPGLGLTPDGTALWFCGSPGALAWLRAEDVPVPRLLSWDQRAAPSHRVLADVVPTMINPRHRLLDAAAVRRWHDQGVRVCTWTVDRSRRRRQLLSWGVDALISNDVRGLVRDVRRERARRAGVRSVQG